MKNFYKSFCKFQLCAYICAMSKTKHSRNNRSKYNFGKMQVGHEFEVEPWSVHSMTCSLRAFNKNHGTQIEVEPMEGSFFNDKVTYKVISI